MATLLYVNSNGYIESSTVPTSSYQLDADSLVIVDDTDPTKELTFDVSGVPTGTTVVITVPSADITVAGRNTTTLGDLVVDDGTAHARLPVGADNSFLMADSAQPLGVKYSADLPVAKGSIFTHDGVNDLVDRPVGADNSLLVADSAQPSGLNYATAASLLGASTKGDLLVHDGANLVRVPVGADGTLLTADSAQASGVAWQAAANSNPMTTKGDLLGHTGAALARVPVGADGTVLTANSAEATGVEWAADTTPASQYFDAQVPGDFATVKAALDATASGRILVTADTTEVDGIESYNYTGIHISVAPSATWTVATLNLVFTAAASIRIDGGGRIQLDATGTAFITNNNSPTYITNVVLERLSGTARVGAGENITITNCFFENSVAGGSFFVDCEAGCTISACHFNDQGFAWTPVTCTGGRVSDTFFDATDAASTVTSGGEAQLRNIRTGHAASVDLPLLAGASVDGFDNGLGGSVHNLTVAGASVNVVNGFFGTLAESAAGSAWSFTNVNFSGAVSLGAAFAIDNVTFTNCQFLSSVTVATAATNIRFVGCAIQGAFTEGGLTNVSGCTINGAVQMTGDRSVFTGTSTGADIQLTAASTNCVCTGNISTTGVVDSGTGNSVAFNI